jgi:hypothetical protein
MPWPSRSAAIGKNVVNLVELKFINRPIAFGHILSAANAAPAMSVAIVGASPNNVGSDLRET